MANNANNLNKYNKIFEKLCADDDNLNIYDMVAYGLYKKAKRTFITNHKETKKKNPTQREIDNYVASAEAHLESYKSQSEKMVSELFNNLMDDKLPEIENQILKRNLKPSFWFNVLTNIISSFIWAVILVVMYFIISDYSCEKGIKEYFNKHKTETIDSAIIK